MDIQRHVRDIHLQLLTYQRGLGSRQKTERHLKQLIDTLEKYLVNLPQFEKDMIRNDHELGPKLDDLYATTHEMIKDATSILHHLLIRIMLNQFGYNTPPNRTRFVSTIFEQFVKGITYFINEQEANVYPIYHRLVSCGPIRDVTYADFHTCYAENPNNEIAKDRIRKCYLERLIYDNIYKNQALFSQDEGHEHWLQKTKNDFNSCFPNIDIAIDIKYHNIHPHPIYLKADIYRHSILQESVEFYRKLQVDSLYPQYSDIVHCVRQKHHRGSVQYYEKFQDFTQSRTWIRTEGHPEKNFVGGTRKKAK